MSDRDTLPADEDDIDVGYAARTVPAAEPDFHSIIESIWGECEHNGPDEGTQCDALASALAVPAAEPRPCAADESACFDPDCPKHGDSTGDDR